MRLIDLTIERQSEPIGIGTERPRFGWSVDCGETEPSGYEIVVSLGPDVAWASGPVTTDRHWDIEYAGAPLKSDRRYEWRVRAWNEDGTTPWAASFFETSLLSENDWTARWLVPQQEPTFREDYTIRDVIDGFTGPDLSPRDRLRPPLHVRQEFELHGAPRRARLFASAHGIYEAEVNGLRVGDEVLAPGYDTYSQRLSFQCYDVTPALRAGRNVIGITVADGWWTGRIGITGSSAPYGDELAVIWQLSLEFDDGRRIMVSSGDREARSSPGAWEYADLFIGERFDARMIAAGWSSPGFDANPWLPVSISASGRPVLTPFIGEPVRRTQVIEPAEVTTIDDRTVLIDVGQVIAGRMRLVLDAPRGAEVTIHHSETLDPDGRFFNNIAGPNKDQVDVFVAAGSGNEAFEPTFTFHGFRYALLEADTPVSLRDVQAVVLGSDLRRTSSLVTSDERVNQLHENIVWSQRGNFLSVPTDCPQRERAGWTGDLQVFARSAATNMDVRAFVDRWLANVRAEQHDDGGVPVVVPDIPSMHSPEEQLVVAAGWSDAITMVPWAMYERYGDRRVLAENYDAMRRWVDFQARNAATTLPERLEGAHLDESAHARHRLMWNSGWQFGDWLAPSALRDGVDPSGAAHPSLGGEVIAAMFHAHSTRLASSVAAVLEKHEEAAELAIRAAAISRAFVEEYVADDGTLPLDLQGPLVLALAFDLVPADRRPLTIARLTQLVEQNDGHLDTGFLSTPYLLDVLWDAGERALARSIFWKSTPPSWLYAVDMGATTTWESWETIQPDGTPTVSSLNHYAFGCVDDWVFRRQAGIAPAEPGYRRVRIAPDVEGPLNAVRARIDTVRGPISVDWSRSGASAVVEVDLPRGVAGELELKGAVEMLSPGRHTRTVAL